MGRQEAEKGPEAVVASSVCLGNNAGDASNDQKHRAKRKNWEGEESGYQSEDLDDDSTGLKKPSAGPVRTSTKRSRAAEMHNLSERKRRDRINDKMCALQELIPNCNKVDKASMLDEAIEYLKTLQIQVQRIPKEEFAKFPTFPNLWCLRLSEIVMDKGHSQILGSFPTMLT